MLMDLNFRGNMKKSAIYTLLIACTLTMSGCGYNQIQQLDETAEKTMADIEAQLQRRADLIPNLVQTVKGFAAHEENVFTSVAESRSRLNGAIQSGDPEQMAAANSQMTGALGRLLAIVEAYPDLKSNQNFLNLQAQLEGTENRIATRRTDYNEAVQQYNAFIRKFPEVLTAKVIGAQPRKYFDAAPGSAEAPNVDFGN